MPKEGKGKYKKQMDATKHIITLLVSQMIINNGTEIRIFIRQFQPNF